jgi:hypothetical protein
MSPEQVEAGPDGQPGPPREFWESELEVAHDHVIRESRRDGFWDEWLAGRSLRQAELIAGGLGLAAPDPGRRRRRKPDLARHVGRLVPYLLVQEFAKFKSQPAVVEGASARLPAEAVEACRKGGDDFDKLALCFALYNRDRRDLTLVLHLDKLHKSGFARMQLRQDPRRPARPFGEFLRSGAVGGLLAAFDREAGDGRVSELKGVHEYCGNDLVFVRRPERPDRVLRDRALVHGYRPEWVVYDFFDGAKRVNIASLSVAEPLEIANRIAAAYFGRPCEYDNERQMIAPRQLAGFLGALRAGPGALSLVEVSVANSPLNGAPSVRLSDAASGLIGPALDHLERLSVRLLADTEQVEGVRVVFRDKRVGLFFEKRGDDFEVRYADHRLSATERRLFERLMREEYGVPALSTEKRFKRGA